MCVSCGVGLKKAASAPSISRFVDGSAPTLGGVGVAQGASKTAVGLCGIFFGGLGVHKFLLGYNQEGIIMLAIGIGGGIVTFGMASIAIGVVGLIEGVIYLTKSDEDFVETYVHNKKPWF